MTDWFDVGTIAFIVFMIFSLLIMVSSLAYTGFGVIGVAVYILMLSVSIGTSYYLVEYENI